MTLGASLIPHYQERFRQFGDDPLATQMSRQGQQFRFAKLFEIGDLDGATVLDVGCGLGEMYPALRSRFPGALYHGVDVVKDMVTCASTKYPEVCFTVANLLTETLPNQFDFVLVSAVFNNAAPDADEFLETLVERAFALCRRGLGFNFLSTHVNLSEPSMAYHDPARVLDFVVRRLSRKVTLSHHYERCDVAVFAYR